MLLFLFFLLLGDHVFDILLHQAVDLIRSFSIKSFLGDTTALAQDSRSRQYLDIMLPVLQELSHFAFLVSDEVADVTDELFGFVVGRLHLAHNPTVLNIH